MEWREQSAVSCDEAYLEARRWIEAVTGKKFGSQDFRSALENGILLCDLINKIKPGIVKRVNRLPTPIAGLDNLNVFLKACGRLGLKEAQLFHPGDLQDLSTRVTVQHQETNRRLKNVLITIYWLGRQAQCDRLYDGPYLNFKAFEGLLGTALYKALHETSSPKAGSVRDSGFGDSWYSEREEPPHRTEEGGCAHKRDDSLDSLDSFGSQPLSPSSDVTVKGSGDGCCSDTDVDSASSSPVSRMANHGDSTAYRRSVSITPKSTAAFNQFLPTKDKQSAYVPAPLRKKRAERNEDSRRSWTNASPQEDESILTRQRQAQESIDGSKSTNDIQVDIKVLRQQSYEELQKHRDKMKEIDDKWQDDLSKWKSRRRSVNSDMVKKKEEREKIEQITYGGNRRSRTFKEMQEERGSKGRLSSLSYLDTEDDAFEAPVASLRTRTLPERSYTIDTPYTHSEAQTTSPPASRDVADGPTSPAGHSPVLRSRSPAAEPLHSGPVSAGVRAEENTSVDASSSSSSSPARKPAEARYPLLRKQAVEEKQQPQPNSMDAKPPPATSQVSSSLPRSYQRAESSHISSVVTPRPFGVQSSRVTSLPRASTLDDTSRGINGKADVSKRATVPDRYEPFVTSDDAQSSSSQSSSDEDEKAEKKADTSLRSVTSTQTISVVKSAASGGADLDKVLSQENHCEMRISLNQKPNSSKDFGFEAAWDSTGARVTSVQKGSQAEMCQLRAGDEVLTVNRHQVAGMSYVDWKSCMEEALQEGSLVMDVRRQGQNNWDRDQPSLPFKSHKTINLTSTDHTILLGSPDSNSVSSSLDFTSHSPKEVLPTPTHQIIDLATNGVNGGGREEPPTMRNKDSESISLKNLKRRSEFFEKAGSDAAMPDITVPPITAASNRWSWDPEEERKRQEKWQKEQQRVLQEKYKRDQEKLQEEWMKAQKDISKSPNQQESWRLEVNSHSSTSPLSLSPFSQPSSPLWELEERKRREEQERQRQAEERRKREEEEWELQRLQEERRRREEEERELQRLQEEEEQARRRRQEEEERKKRQEEELRWEKRREEERAAQERRRQEEAEQLRREQRRSLEQQQWADGYHRFTNIQPVFSFDRTKSKSSPQLDEEERTQWKGMRVQLSGLSRQTQEQVRSTRDYWSRNERAAAELERERRSVVGAMRRAESPLRGPGGSGGGGEKKAQQSVSQAEAERQQILNEMKKKTHLLTDSSWIRQRPATTVREVDIPPMRRGESLDGLDSSWRSSWAPSSASTNSYGHGYRLHSALAGSSAAYGGPARTPRPQSATLTSSYSMSSLRGGAGTPSSNWSQQSRSSSASSPSPASSPEPPHQRSRSVSGKKICTFCDTPLGKGAAMIIESLGLCYHLGCFKCFDCKSDLGGSEAGAEVRIRNRQLYCNICYMQFKIGQPTTM